MALNVQPAARQIGATLIEASMVLSIASTLASIAVPGMTQWLGKEHIASTSNELLSAVNVARSEAIMRGSRVVIAARDSTDWGSGWHVFADTNNNGEHDAGETVIREQVALPAHVSIEPHFGITYAGSALSFDASGRLQRPNGGMVIGRLVISNETGARSVCFATTRVRVARAATCA